MGFLFLVNSILLGVGLAMDAFSVSLANGIHEPSMQWKKMGIIAGTFGFFQFIMPLAGWACVNWIIDIFQSVLPYIPWISLILLLTLGILMVKDGLSGQEEEVCPETDFKCLLIQGLATSMDALSVGFTIASYDGQRRWQRLLSSALLHSLSASWASCWDGASVCGWRIKPPLWAASS